MSSVLIAYATTEGHTRKIADHVASVIRGAGHKPHTIGLASDPGAPSEYDAVIIASSIHVGKHDKAATAYIKKYREELAAMPTLFLSVSMAATHKDDGEAEGYVQTFLEETGWKPSASHIIAGALLYTQYGFFKRLLMKRIVQSKGGDTDTSRDYIYTDWNELTTFVQEFLTGHFSQSIA